MLPILILDKAVNRVELQKIFKKRKYF